MSTTKEGRVRIEKDTMGEVHVPEDAYYGAQTQRAVDNFPISQLRFQRRFIRALALIKLAAAKSNMALNLLDSQKGQAIITAAQEVAEGRFDNQFVVDVFQTGSGTSTNMNANEVIANRAIESLGGEKGDKKIIHANDDVNMGQSTNDVFPTAIHLSTLEALEQDLLPALKVLEASFSKKSLEFEGMVKAGRTHLQDAVPMTLGQEFGGYTSMISHGIERIMKSKTALEELPLGGTAVGTGLNAHPEFAAMAIRELELITGLKLRGADNLFEAMQGKDACVEVSGAIKVIATSLMKIANDLRLLYSGPTTGFNEIELPATQPGSSIMPAKVNPVIPEAVNMVSAKVIGNDLTVTLCGQAGNLELNTMMPAIAYVLLESIEIEANVARTLATSCVDGIRANEEKIRRYAEETIALVTVIAPAVGYDNAARIAKLVLEGKGNLRQVILKEGLLSEEKLDAILDLKKITQGGRV
ncbi:MAG: aspartate ammonia-lyase [Thaumarchaeota archaeon]|nr:aspartate ammonia-lyase [Nitrososphaerota archaeon]